VSPALRNGHTSRSRIGIWFVTAEGSLLQVMQQGTLMLPGAMRGLRTPKYVQYLTYSFLGRILVAKGVVLRCREFTTTVTRMRELI
jgi:hypothetical protein